MLNVNFNGVAEQRLASGVDNILPRQGSYPQILGIWLLGSGV
jgi:hypothetical protein